MVGTDFFSKECKSQAMSNIINSLAKYICQYISNLIHDVKLRPAIMYYKLFDLS